MKQSYLKVISIILLVILLANMVLFAVGKVSGLVFWIIIAVGFIYAFKILPRLRKT